MGGWLILHFTPSSTLLALSRNLHQTGCSLQLWNRLPRKCECFFFHLAQRLCTNSLAMPSCNISCGVCVCVCSVISQLQNCWVLIQSHCSMMCLWIDQTPTSSFWKKKASASWEESKNKRMQAFQELDRKTQTSADYWNPPPPPALTSICWQAKYLTNVCQVTGWISSPCVSTWPDPITSTPPGEEESQ